MAAKVSFNDIVNAINNGNATMSAGNFITSGQRRTIRIIGEITDPDELGNFVSMERFMENLDLNHPIDMLISKKGELYILEYGSTWYTQNKDAQIIKITTK